MKIQYKIKDGFIRFPSAPWTALLILLAKLMIDLKGDFGNGHELFLCHFRQSENPERRFSQFL